MDFLMLLGKNPAIVMQELQAISGNVEISETLDPRSNDDSFEKRVIRIQQDNKTTKILVGCFKTPSYQNKN